MKFLKKLGIESHNSAACSGQTWITGSKDQIITSINPANEQAIAHVNTSDVSDYENILQRAEKAAIEWQLVPAPKRGEIIRQIGDALRVAKEDLGTLVSLEMGKSKQEGLGEVQEMIDMADFAVGQSRMLYGKTMHSERPEHRMYEQWHPYGIVGVITAFNFPVAVWSWNAFIAAICGNVVIWKPSSKTPLCTIAVQKICESVLKANNCPDIFSFFISHDHDLAEKFIADKRIALISFTGSTHTGRHVSEVVSHRLGRSILELGGNNAIIVDETADLQLALRAIVFGAIGTAGQRCTSTRRLIIHESIYDRVLKQLIETYKQITIGDPLAEGILMGPLVDNAAVVKYQQAIATIQKQGGKIVYGGNVLQGPGFYVEPTLVTDVSNDWDIVQQETFAPILYVMKYSEFQDAITIQNSVAQGLTSALFTTCLQRAEHYLSAKGSDCGVANINVGTSGVEIGAAFGGEKETGGGRESGSDAWKAYMRRQSNTINWGQSLPLAQGIQFEII